MLTCQTWDRSAGARGLHVAFDEERGGGCELHLYSSVQRVLGVEGEHGGIHAHG